jgi:hypothetical protein
VFSWNIKDEWPVLFEKGNAPAAVGVGRETFGPYEHANRQIVFGCKVVQKMNFGPLGQQYISLGNTISEGQILAGKLESRISSEERIASFDERLIVIWKVQVHEMGLAHALG